MADTPMRFGGESRNVLCSRWTSAVNSPIQLVSHFSVLRGLRRAQAGAEFFERSLLAVCVDGTGRPPFRR
jgi:hypothetical protein